MIDDPSPIILGSRDLVIQPIQQGSVSAKGGSMRDRSLNIRSLVSVLRRIALLVSIVLLAGAAGGSRPVAAVPAAHEPVPGVPPEVALSRLKEGNLRFRSDAMQHPNLGPERRRETAEKGQAPFATILSCSDSRVPCELIFDQGIGDLFIVRVAGNVCDVDETGSIEYGIGHLGTSLLVVLGHEKCGAVTAAAKGGDLEGSIPQLVDNIRPAVAEAQRLHPRMDPEPLVTFALRANVLQSIEDLLRRSEVARDLVREGKVSVVGAVYDIESGEVTWLGSHPRQIALLKENGTGANGGVEHGSAPGQASESAHEPAGH
jgi:carbonic anhydrase